MIIAPSILSADLYNLENDLKKIGNADWIHIDSMDGVFVNNLTFGSNIVHAIRPHTDQLLDCHLMVDRPEKYIDAYAEAGADIITIHYEATPHPHRVLQQIREKGIRAGISINPGTSVEAIKALLPFVDLVLVMTVNPGFGGQSFIPEMLDKVSLLSDLRRINSYSFYIQVDGGVTNETAVDCVEAGADCLVSGSYVFNQEDPQEAISHMQNL
ncbi:MAG: ribulose-phosphate 3-epimerase [Atopococcus tabaci]|uniref:Ribulose-phosphate 3-epimerase n=1 Tax=Atopococcus tabaci TaxID=269774 RepID=A0AA43UBP7_9LACT|nr:ribulose-phosphate 3-epimerase [Atopococcus tabaci]